MFSCCFGPKGVSSNDERKALFLCELHFSLILTSGPLNHQRTNNQHITLLYNEMKSLSSIFSCCFGPKGVSSRKALFLCQLHFSPIFTSRSLNNQRTNKQLITLLHNEMKSSIFSCCNGINSVLSKKEWKAFYQWDNHVSAAAVVPRLCLLTMIEKLYFSVKYTFYLFLQVVL